MARNDKDRDVDFRALFERLSKPLTCGVVHDDGVRYQKSRGEWSSERIFVLSDEIRKEKPTVIYRSYYDSDGSWRQAIARYLRYDRAFMHPRLRMYCIQRDMVTVRNLDFDLDIL